MKNKIVYLLALLHYNIDQIREKKYLMEKINMDKKNDNAHRKKIEIEAATFRRLKEYLAENTSLQNIELMNLAGFCRNCLARWYQEEALDRNVNISKDESRELFYGMPYNDWKEKFQK